MEVAKAVVIVAMTIVEPEWWAVGPIEAVSGHPQDQLYFTVQPITSLGSVSIRQCARLPIRDVRYYTDTPILMVCAVWTTEITVTPGPRASVDTVDTFDKMVKGGVHCNLDTTLERTGHGPHGSIDQLGLEVVAAMLVGIKPLLIKFQMRTIRTGIFRRTTLTTEQNSFVKGVTLVDLSEHTPKSRLLVQMMDRATLGGKLGLCPIMGIWTGCSHRSRTLTTLRVCFACHHTKRSIISANMTPHQIIHTMQSSDCIAASGRRILRPYIRRLLLLRSPLHLIFHRLSPLPFLTRPCLLNSGLL